MINIQDISLESLQVYKTLRDNAFDNKNSFIADSPKLVNLLLQSDIEILSILATQAYYEQNKTLIESKNIQKLFVADKEMLQSIVGHKIHHNCMAHGIRPPPHSIDELDDTIVMLDNITSTENIGSIARSMAGLGVLSYLVAQTSPHPYSRRALRVSMGYMSKLKYHIYTDTFSTLQILKNRGYKIFAAEVSDNSTWLQDVVVPSKWVLLMGHEGKGISKEILDICDEVVTIQMQENVKSLNVGVAASLMMYQFCTKMPK
ncbi:MAG: RNA methyltransferase [Sulfurimonas sp.]|nr:RNA methyltransferase [Sulfurimonas sp.]PHQ92551.1 MAG: rRNA methyltransferase [Sulfurimonas sp.]